MIGNRQRDSWSWIFSSVVWMGLLWVAATASSGTIAGQTVDDDFATNCSGCHTIGGGALLGPDLKGLSERQSREWLVDWLMDPLGVLLGGDPYAVELQRASRGAVMPPTPDMNEAWANQLLDFIDAQSQLEPAPSEGAEAEQPLGPEEASQGRELFIGVRLSENGAPACIACHTVSGLGSLGGGRLGPDLTHAYGRLGGREGLIPWLGAVPSATMRPIFQEHPLAEDEVLALTAFLKEETENDLPENRAAVVNFLLFGLVGATVLLAVFDRLWNKRFTAVRKPLVKERKS